MSGDGGMQTPISPPMAGTTSLRPTSGDLDTVTRGTGAWCSGSWRTSRPEGCLEPGKSGQTLVWIETNLCGGFVPDETMNWPAH